MDGGSNAMRVGVWLLLWAIGAAGAQTIPPATAAALQGLAARADVIFAGQVVAVARHDEAGYVDVLFQVDSAVRGCSSPGTYRVREWAGLWGDGAPRYAGGQRLLMLLRVPGPSGMSAPVGGMAGRIPLAGTRNPPLLRGDGTAPAESAVKQSDEAVDLRWVQALAVRHPITAQPMAPGTDDLLAPRRQFVRSAVAL